MDYKLYYLRDAFSADKEPDWDRVMFELRDFPYLKHKITFGKSLRRYVERNPKDLANFLGWFPVFLRAIQQHEGATNKKMIAALLSAGYYDEARDFGATEAEIEQRKLAEEFHNIMEIRDDNTADQIVTYMRDLLKRGFNFRFSKTSDALIFNLESPWTQTIPIYKFLIEEAKLDPRKHLDTAMEYDPDLAVFLFETFRCHRASQMSKKLDRTYGIIKFGNFGDDKPLSRVPDALRKRITLRAAAVKLCEDIKKDMIPPRDLVGLAQLLKIDFSSKTNWDELCRAVLDSIKSRRL